MHRSTRRFLVAAAVVVVALVATLVATTFRGDTMPRAEYERTVRAQYARVQEAFRNTRVNDPAQLDERVAAAQRELRGVADELEAIDPPRDVDADNDALAAAMRDYAQDLEPLRAAAARGDADAIEEFNRGIAGNDAVRRMAAAGERMKEKGYDVGPLAED